MVVHKLPTAAGKDGRFIEALRSLDASGSQGFEGLLSDLLAALTGQSFRVLKPGPQGGVDVLPVHRGNGVVVGLEGKRYGEKTQLKVDALKAKIVDAIDTYPELDLWLLAASREVKANDQRDLKALGEKGGIAVEVIDWPTSRAALPRLAVLCAAAPGVVRAHLGNYPGVSEYLQTIANHPQFASMREELLRCFTAADVGYASARRHLASWTRQAFQDLPTANARLGPYTNLLDKDVHLVSRSVIHSVLDDWFGSRSDVPLAVLGEEGLGKTWAVLSWWHERTGPSSEELPLALIVPARSVNTTDVEILLAETLAKRTELRDAGFWQRRLRLWRRNGSPHPKILLLIDGLNENKRFSGWTELLQPLLGHGWRGFVTVILTCRPDDWNNSFKQLCDLDPKAEETTVVSFSDLELDELLRTHNLQRSDFAEELIPLIRVPRLCQRAIKRRAEMEGSADLTNVRLILEDWRDRLAIHGVQLTPTAEDFRKFVCGLGERLRAQLQSSGSSDITMSRKELFEALSRDSGAAPRDLGMAVSEIVDGRWMPKVGEHQFRLRRDLAPFALGLALVDQLKLVESAEIQDRLAQFLDPIRGADIAPLRSCGQPRLLRSSTPKLSSRFDGASFRIGGVVAAWGRKT